MTDRIARDRRVLVTGGTGFAGGYLCPRLVEAYPDSARLLLTRTGDPVSRSGFTTRPIDLTNRAAVEAAVAEFRPDVVAHLAAHASLGASAASNEDFWRVNFEATLHLAGAVARHVPNAAVLFVSSAEVYGYSFRDGPASEETYPRPTNAYARAKLAAEQALADVLPATASLIVARAFNHTGPGQDTRFVLPAFAAQIAKIEAGHIPPRLMVGNLDAERDFLDVRDVCDAYVALLRCAAPGCRETVNVSSGRAWRIGDLLGELRAMSRRPFEVVQDPDRMRPSDIPRSVGSCAKLARLTEWTPKYAIALTLHDILERQRQSIAA